jgi:hypothetical protein
MRPRVLNFSRPLYLREIMVANGDEQKPIWVTEMNWNAPPADFANKQFGYVTLEQQGRYAVEAFQRAQQEWPWLGVVNVWFFKRASDAEIDQPWYYFRLVEPDFQPLPIYHALTAYFHSPEARTLYPGVHQEDHWVLDYEGEWQARAEVGAELGAARYAAGPDAALALPFEGSGLWLKAGSGAGGRIAYSLDGGAEKEIDLAPGQEVALARDLAPGRHTARLRAVSGTVSVDSLTVKDRTPARLGFVVAGGGLLVVLMLVVVWLVARRRRRWYERSRAAG